MAVASMHLGVWSWSRQSPELQTEALRTLSVSIQFNKKMFYTVNFIQEYRKKPSLKNIKTILKAKGGQTQY